MGSSEHADAWMCGLHTGSLKVALLATEFTGCILGWEPVARMNVSVAPDTSFLSI